MRCKRRHDSRKAKTNLQYIRSPVSTLCNGQACSMGSLLLAAGMLCIPIRELQRVIMESE